MAATVRVSYWNGAGNVAGTGVTAETGIKFNRDNTQTGTTAIPIPTAAGTRFSWPKWTGLEVTTTDTTSLSNRRIRMAAGIATGMALWWQAVVAASYVTPVAVAAADTGANGSTPAGYTAMTTSDAVYQAASVSAGSTGLNGGFVELALGVDFLYVGGASSNAAVPTLTYTYDEA